MRPTAVEGAKPDAVAVEVQVACAVDTFPNQAEVAAWLTRAVYEARGSESPPLEVAVRFVDEGEMRRLNADYRGKDRPTNVLAFPVSASVVEMLPSDEPQPLGDIVLCKAVLEREAAEQLKPDDAHQAHLLIHGMLHLLGYDHQCADSAAEMEELEVRILAAGGLADPYRDAVRP